MPKVISTGYIPNPQQVKFHTSPARYRFYGGAAGGGKTRALIEEVLAQIAEAENAGVKLTAIMFRRTFPELEGSVIKEFLNIVPSMGVNAVCKYNYSVHKAKFPKGSTLAFAFCSNENDVYKYQGSEFDLIAIDELTHFTEYQFKYLMSRLRTVKPGIFANFIGASNPGNVGHAWVKRLWVDRHLNPDEERESDEYDFVPAKIWDNKVLLENDPSYVDRLKALPDNQRRALLEGDWDLFEGQFFTDWNRKYHVCKPFEIPAGWLRYRSIDYGFRAPFCCLWFAIDYDGRVWCYKELYQTEQTAKQNAEKIIDMSQGETYQYTTIDPSVFTRSHTGESISEVLMMNGIQNIVKADNERIGGWNSVRQYLHVEDDYAELCIFDNCRNLIRTLPEQQYDPNRADDIDTRGEDHASDSLRYFLHTLRNRKSTKPMTGVAKKIEALQSDEDQLTFNYNNDE